MYDIVIIVTIVNIIYFVIWISINKLRSSNNMIVRQWDNGNDFYESLNQVDKKIYWQQDTHILNIVFLVLFLFINCTLFLIYKENNYWIVCFLVGLILSCTIGILMSLKLRKRFK